MTQGKLKKKDTPENQQHRRLRAERLWAEISKEGKNEGTRKLSTEENTDYGAAKLK